MHQNTRSSCALNAVNRRFAYCEPP